MSGRGRELYGVWATTICWTWRSVRHCSSATMIQVLLGSNLLMINIKHSCYVMHTYTLYQNSSNGYWVNGTDPWQKHNVYKPCGSIQNSKQECGMNKQSHKQLLWNIHNSNELLGMLTVVVSEILHIKLCWWAWAVSSRLFHSLNCRQSSSEIHPGHPSAGSWWGQNVPCTVGDFCTTCTSIFIYREVSFLQRVQPFVMPRQPQWLGYAGLCLMLKQCL